MTVLIDILIMLKIQGHTILGSGVCFQEGWRNMRDLLVTQEENKSWLSMSETEMAYWLAVAQMSLSNTWSALRNNSVGTSPILDLAGEKHTERG